MRYGFDSGEMGRHGIEVREVKWTSVLLMRDRGRAWPFDRENTGVIMMAYKIMPGSRLSLTYMENLRMVQYECRGVAP